MMKYKYIAILFLLFSCNQGGIVLEIGTPKEIFKTKLLSTNRVALINSGTISELYLFKNNGKEYLISFDKNDKIDYFIVLNTDFITLDGLKQGDGINKVKDFGGEIYIEEGVCLFASLKSGWYAYLEDINYNMDDIENTNIKFFYKKNPLDNFFFMSPEEYKLKYKNAIPVNDTIRLKKILLLEV